MTVIRGSRTLPPGYDHPHASEQARRIAEEGVILRAQVGSGVHGTSISGQDDRDEMGLCLEPPQYVTGLARVPAGVAAQTSAAPFEQYQRHTAWDQPGGLANRSGAGDLDVVGAVDRAEEQLLMLRCSSVLPAEPDRAWVDDWLHRSYTSFWASG